MAVLAQTKTILAWAINAGSLELEIVAVKNALTFWHEIPNKSTQKTLKVFVIVFNIRQHLVKFEFEVEDSAKLGRLVDNESLRAMLCRLSLVF